MPIKKLRVSFDIDMEVLAKVLVAGHTDMNIQAFGTEEPRVSRTEPIAQITNRSGLSEVILRALSKPKKLRMHEMRAIIVQAGYSAKSLNSAIFIMQGDGLVRRAGYGIYAITRKGLNHVGA